MVWYLLKRDDTTKMALTAVVLAPMVLFSGFPALSGFLGGLVFLGFGAAARFRHEGRTTHFELGLPIAGRQLLLVRVIGTSLMIWIPVVAAVLVLLAVGRGGDPLVRDLPAMAAILMAAVMVPLTVRPREATIPMWLTGTLGAAVGAIGAGAWFLVPRMATLGIFLLLSAALMVRACSAVPAALEAAPREARDGRALLSRQWAQQSAWWPIVRTAGPWMLLFYFAMGALPGSPADVKIAWWALLLIAGFQVRDRSRWLEAFPLSRRALLAISLTPVFAWLAGAAARMPFDISWDVPNTAGLISGGPEVSLEYWRHAPPGKLPSIQSPWGESAQPRSISILGTVFYDPYTVARSNSHRFFEWQFARVQALTAAPARKRMNAIALPMLLAWLLATALVREWILSWKRSAIRTRCLVFVLVMAGTLLGLDWFCVWRGDTMVAQFLVNGLLLRASAALPDNLAAAMAIASIPAILIYLLTERQFVQSETASAIFPGWDRSRRV